MTVRQLLRTGATRAYALLDLALGGLDLIAHLTATSSDDEAVAALKGVKAVVDTVHAGFAGHVSPEAATVALAVLRTKLSDNDAAADKALAAKFAK